MKRILAILLLLSCIISVSNADSKKKKKAKKQTAEMLLSTINEQWKVSDDKIFVQKVIDLEGTSKDEAYVKLLEFMTNTYTDGNEVIQVKEKENGLIVGKGNSSFYVNEIFAGSAIKQTVWHIFKAEIKEDKVRITITIELVDWSSPASTVLDVYISAKDGKFPIVNCYPIGEDDSKRKRSGYIFYYAVNNIIELMNATEEFLKSTSEISTSDDW